VNAGVGFGLNGAGVMEALKGGGAKGAGAKEGVEEAVEEAPPPNMKPVGGAPKDGGAVVDVGLKAKGEGEWEEDARAGAVPGGPNEL
jgi:hypothetical protein